MPDTNFNLKIPGSPANPIHQAIYILIAGILFMGISVVFPMSPQAKMAQAMPWVIACAMVLLFALANAVLSLMTKEGQRYWMVSIFSYAGLFIVLCVLARIISGIGIDEAGSIRWVLTVFTFGYLILLSIVNLIKFFVFLAERSDAKKRESENH